MSGNVWYWSFVGIGFVLTMAAGIMLMRKTNRLGFSFLLSSVLNLAVFAAASLWWFGQTSDSFERATGIAFYGIAFVNVAAFDIFALASMRKQPPESDKRVQESGE